VVALGLWISVSWGGGLGGAGDDAEQKRKTEEVFHREIGVLRKAAIF
jgi:hypothetical protein